LILTTSLSADREIENGFHNRKVASSPFAREHLDALSTSRPAFEGLKAKGAVWTRPELRALIAYRGVTAGGELRAASFKGLREAE
jgi:ATP-dependent DNA ligase